jgi:hypothetical protein
MRVSRVLGKYPNNAVQGCEEVEIWGILLHSGEEEVYKWK